MYTCLRRSACICRCVAQCACVEQLRQLRLLLLLLLLLLLWLEERLSANGLIAGAEERRVVKMRRCRRRRWLCADATAA